MKTLLRNKFFILGSIILLFIGLFIFASAQWNYCIETRLCTYNAVDSYYRPFYYASLSLLTFFVFFLFLPFRYFKQWLIWIFSWGIILSYSLVKHNLQPGGSMFEPPANRLVVILAIIFWIITILFCLILWSKERKMK